AHDRTSQAHLQHIIHRQRLKRRCEPLESGTRLKDHQAHSFGVRTTGTTMPVINRQHPIHVRCSRVIESNWLLSTGSRVRRSSVSLWRTTPGVTTQLENRDGESDRVSPDRFSYRPLPWRLPISGGSAPVRARGRLNGLGYLSRKCARGIS